MKQGLLVNIVDCLARFGPCDVALLRKTWLCVHKTTSKGRPESMGIYLSIGEPIMAPWIWLVIGGLLFRLLYSAFRAYVKSENRRHRLGNHENEEMDLHLPSPAFISGALLMDLTNKVPSSVYHGSIIFFDSIKHRDMFEANEHRPLPMNSIMVPSVERNGRSIERSLDTIMDERPTSSWAKT